MKKENCYVILGLPLNASAADIKKAYRNLSKRYHPDVNKDADAHDKFIAISEAYEYLSHLPPLEIHYNEVSEEYTGADNLYFEAYRQKMRQRAEQKARMRYQEFLRQEKAFRESGLADILLLLKIAIRLMALPVALFLFVGPFWLDFKSEDSFVSYIIFAYFTACSFILFVVLNRKDFLKFESFYYTPQRILRLFTETTRTTECCWYCKNRLANSIPYSIELLRLKDIKLKSNGFRQHQANYIDDSAKIEVPRSQKAHFIHALVAIIKVLSILAVFIFSDYTSLVWRFVIGLVLGLCMSQMLLWVSRTKSSVSYLLTVDSLIRIVFWLFLLFFISDFSFNPIDIKTDGAIYLLVTSMFIFDCVVVQLNSILLGDKAFRTLIKQHPLIENKTKLGFKLYDDIPVVSFVYPLLKWILG